MKKKNILKKIMMYVFVFVLLFMVPAQAQAASVTGKALNKKVTGIVKKKVKAKDSKAKKLEKLFKYTEKSYGYARSYGFKKKKGWEKNYAMEMYKKKKGSCYHFAASYAFLAKKATNYTVRVGVGKTNGFNPKNLQDHAWVEIKIKNKWYICDPNMDKFAENSSGTYFLKERNELKGVYANFKGAKYYKVKF